MPDHDEKKGSNEDVKSILMEDYRALTDAIWKNEQIGETRVDWFITIVAAVLGGLVSLTTTENRPADAGLQVLFMGSVLALLMLGVVTLKRVLKRNETTDGFKKDLLAIRQIFKDRFDSDHLLLGYQPFTFNGKSQRAGASMPGDVIQLRKIGGLSHILAVINSILLGAFVTLAVNFCIHQGRLLGLSVGELRSMGIVGLLAMTVSVVAHFVSIHLHDQRLKESLQTSGVTHAGGIVYKLDGTTVTYLIVSPLKEPGKWVFPKGHVNWGEGHAEAALREVREETGVVAKLICLVGDSEFDAKDEHVNLKLYLMEVDHLEDAAEKRAKDWVTFDRALKLLTYENTRSLFQAAERIRTSRGNLGM